MTAGVSEAGYHQHTHRHIYAYPGSRRHDVRPRRSAPSAPLFVLSHRPAPQMGGRQTLITSGIEDAVAAARQEAGDKDVALMGGGVVTDALQAGLVDELVLHQVPVLLGAGAPTSKELPEHIRLGLLEVVPAAGVHPSSTASSAP